MGSWRVVIVLYLLLLLLFSNTLLLLCNDELYCMFPVSNQTLHTHLAFKLSNFYSQWFPNLKQALVTANWILYIEIVAGSYYFLTVLRNCLYQNLKYLKLILRVLILTVVILYTLYSYSEYKNSQSAPHSPWRKVQTLFGGISRFLREVLRF